jgi:hypothetical protein
VTWCNILTSVRVDCPHICVGQLPRVVQRSCTCAQLLMRYLPTAVAKVADMFKKHVAHPTLDACTRALVHATSDGSDATKVGTLSVTLLIPAISTETAGMTRRWCNTADCHCADAWLCHMTKQSGPCTSSIDASTTMQQARLPCSCSNILLHVAGPCAAGAGVSGRRHCRAAGRGR